MELKIEGTDEVIEDLKNINYRAMRGAVRSLNRAILAGRTLMARAVARDIGLPVGEVKAAMQERQATLDRLEASFGTGLKRIPLIYFKAKQTRTGVSYRLGAGKSLIPHAFLAKMQSGHAGVFARRGKTHLPIKEKWGPSLGHVFAKHRPEGRARTKEAFDAAFKHELERLTDKDSKP
jgi:hypothetical protein